jgi:hypothetical protein
MKPIYLDLVSDNSLHRQTQARFMNLYFTTILTALVVARTSKKTRETSWSEGTSAEVSGHNKTQALGYQVVLHDNPCSDILL